MKHSFLAILGLALILGACGKNDQVAPIQNYPQTNPAPPPSNYNPNQSPYGGSYQPPTGGYPQPGTGYQQTPYPYNNGGGYFNPNLPQSGPFLPAYQQWNQSPQGGTSWNQTWNDGWVPYAEYYGYDEYDFDGFWNDYCQTQLNVGNSSWYVGINNQYDPLSDYYNGGGSYNWGGNGGGGVTWSSYNGGGGVYWF